MIVDSKQLTVRRFRNMIAIDGGKDTMYLSPAMAVMLSKTLIDGAFDVMTNEPEDRQFVTTTLHSSTLEV
jgi:hypothetical protein